MEKEKKKDIVKLVEIVEELGEKIGEYAQENVGGIDTFEDEQELSEGTRDYAMGYIAGLRTAMWEILEKIRGD